MENLQDKKKLFFIFSNQIYFKPKFIFYLSFFIVLFAVYILRFVAQPILAWTPPQSPPPQDNVPMPLNIGPNSQAKIGSFAIGTSTPSNYELDVSGEVRFTESLTAPAFYSGINPVYFLNPTNDVSLNVLGTIQGAADLLVSGNVGIGTTSPGAKLEVYNPSGAGQILVSSSDANSSGIYFKDGATGVYRPASSSDLHFWANGDDRMTITGSGNVGIGTDDPYSKMELSGTEAYDSLTVTRYGSAYGPYNFFRCAMGTKGSPSTTGVNNGLGNFMFMGYDSGWKYGAKFGAFRDGSGTTGNRFPGRLSFFTSESGSASWHERLTIKNDGRVGIGITSPGAKLEVYNPSGAGQILVSSSDANSSGIYFKDGATGVYRPASSSDLHFWANGDDRMTITGSGNVGIGKIDPEAKLDVMGNVLVNNNLTISDEGLTHTDGAVVSIQDDLLFSVESEENALYIDTEGRVGINTDDPEAKLHVNGNALIQYGLDLQYSDIERCYTLNIRPDDDTETGISFQNASGEPKASIYFSYNDTPVDTLQIKNNANLGVAIDNSGNVGIGTTNPEAKLEVYNPSGAGQILVNSSDANSSGIYFKDGATGIYRPASSSDLHFWANGNDRMTITGSGNVGIGIAAPDTALEVDGIVTATSFIGDGSGLTGIAAQGMGSFVGKTDDKYSGLLTTESGLTGYQAGNAICKESYPDSHMCTQMEIIDTINKKDISTLEGWSDNAWVNAGGAKYAPAPRPVNDCNGWTYDNADGLDSYIGSFWIFDRETGGVGGATPCSQLKNLACCK